MKKSKILKLMIVLLSIILIVILAVFILFFNNSTNKNLRYIYDTEVEGQIEKMPLNVVYAISEYKGSVNQRSIYKALYMLVDEMIPKYKNLLSEINEVGISNYFNKNKIEIAKELGITEENDFISFIGTIKELNGETLTLEEYTFHPEGTSKKTGYLQTILLIKYAGNEKIGLYVKLSNEVNEYSYPISVSGGIDKKYLDYEYGSEFVKTDENGNEIKEGTYTPTGRVIN